MIAKIKPALVLAIIVTVMSTLLIVAHNLTYVDTSGVITDVINEKCVTLMGEGEFEIVTSWTEAGYSIEKPDNVEKLIKKDDGSLAFQIIVSGYNKNGLDLLIAMNPDGSVKGISVISISETPGLGTKVNDEGFLSKFLNIKENVEIVRNEPSADNQIEAVTSATYSSRGVARAVNIAINTYKEMGVK